jgi:hypothetical protein
MPSPSDTNHDRGALHRPGGLGLGLGGQGGGLGDRRDQRDLGGDLVDGQAGQRGPGGGDRADALLAQGPLAVAQDRDPDPGRAELLERRQQPDVDGLADPVEVIAEHIGGRDHDHQVELDLAQGREPEQRRSTLTADLDGDLGLAGLRDPGALQRRRRDQGADPRQAVDRRRPHVHPIDGRAVALVGARRRRRDERGHDQPQDRDRASHGATVANAAGRRNRAGQARSRGRLSADGSGGSPAPRPGGPSRSSPSRRSSC